jgi:hypothetical protein
METCDLLAVPGSGKTTALQAKLYCLCQSMHAQLKAGQGILVLSHTNVAVEEIRKKLLLRCPKLFEYPNFVGTIQDFVDTFLAIPCYRQKYGRSISRIDSTIYQAEFLKQLHFKKKDKVWNYFYKVNEEYLPKIANTFDIKVNSLDSFSEWDYSNDKAFSVMKKPPKTWKKEDVDVNINHILSELRGIKGTLWKNGILSYNDCYSFASFYLFKIPKLKQILCNRFPLVFIDETQDLQTHQLEIIDRIFMTAGVCIQRVGDINQSIFHQGSEGKDCPWQLRAKCLTFNKSFRLTGEVGNVVSPFARKLPNTNFLIKGDRSLKNKIAPYILIYDYEHRDALLKRYVELIQFWDLMSTIEAKMYGFHVIGWNVSWQDGELKDNNKLRLCDLYQEYSTIKEQSKTIFDNLSEYIYSAQNKRNSFQLKKLIDNIICESFRLAGFMNSLTVKGRKYETLFSIDSLKKFISSQEESFVDEYNMLCYQCVKSLYNFDYNIAYTKILKLIYTLFEHLNIDKESIVNFISNDVTPNIHKSVEPNDQMTITLSFENVHKIKGQTHCATLYIETCYQGKYESQHLVKKKRVDNPFYGENDNLPKGVHVNSALKVLYVGMSRPTHLLCYAMHKSSFQLYDVNRLRDMGWIVEDITEGK